MRIYLTSVFVNDQAEAMRFYTEVLGFEKKVEVPLGDDYWMTVAAPGQEEVELLLEPAGHPAVKPYREALIADGIPLASFAVDDARAEFERLKGLGVRFVQEPLEQGPVVTAVFDDTCGNLIQIVQTTQ
ncbi:VOC family protein [Spirillospora sp. NPDC127200]